MIELRLLGRFQGRFSSGGPIELTTRKARALLAYLAVHAGQAQSREKLVALLWSDRAERQGRDSLRQALTALRKGLGSEGEALLTVNGDAVAVEPSAVEVDALSFEQLLAGGRPEDLERAVDLYQGDFLDGIGVRDPAFEDWVYAERERLHGRAVEALAKVLAHQAKSGGADRAMATAARLLQLDPLQEMAHRALMRLHAERGQRGLALRQYQACVDILKRELGIAPEPETVALYDSIRQAREPLHSSRVELTHRRRSSGDGVSGAEEAASEETSRAPPATGLLAERRHLTIVFVDLVESMELSMQLDPEQMRDLLLDYQNAVAQEVARFEGHVTNVMGDGVLVYFGWPHAHEDDAERAIRASLAVSTSVSALGRLEDDSLAVRIGVASGLVVVGEGMGHDASIVGETPNLASRLRTLASPGQIILAESTRRLLGDIFDLADLGAPSVLGVREPVRAFAIIGERPVESRFDARRGPEPLPMVGRDQELALLLERWALAKAGEGQGVLLVGEAGIGKSRIGRALLDAVADEPHTRVRYQCSPYHRDSALWPVVQQLTRGAGLVVGDSLDAGLDKLEELLGRAERIESAPLIASLIGLDGAARYGELNLTPQAQRAYTLRALVEQMLGLAARQPVLVVFEDVHWIDPTTLELIEQCLDQIAAARVLILLTSRPDQQPALAAHPHVTRLTLNRLGRGGVEAIITRLGGDHLPVETVDTIIARTDGVPLFVEELTKAVLETGETAIPASLHDSLMARLDRIPEVKEVAQIAACIGREFDFSLMAAVADQSEPDTLAALDRLASAELIFRRGTPPDARYVFKHALVQDAAYASLLLRRRHELHARIGEILEQSFPDRVEAEPESLARHFTEAGRSREAVAYWHKAGERAARRSANLEAVRHLRRGLEVIATVSNETWAARAELELQLALGTPLIAIEGYTADDTVQAFARARELCEQLGEVSRLFQAIYGLWANRAMRAEHDGARRLAEEFLSLAKHHGEIGPTITAHRVLGWSLSLLGELPAGREQLEQALALYDPDEHRTLAYRYGQDPRIAALSILAWNVGLLGYPDTSLALTEEALREAQELNHAFTRAYATYVAGAVPRYLSRDFEGSKAHVDELIAFSQRQGFPFWIAYGTAMRGALLAHDRREEDAVRLAKRALCDLDRLGLGWFRPFILCSLADGRLANHSSDRALDLIAQSLAIVNETDERWIEPELHRLNGEVMLLEGRHRRPEAEHCFGCAIRLAKTQAAKSLELRAATSLSRLWAEQGELQRARDLLAPVYGWFTEGFETADLKDAKALLDEIR
jgi:DNA-binding SARP family transcriptional activator/predicted ATPase